MTSLRGGAAPEASSAVAGSGGMAVSSVSRARWSRASAAAWATAASASGEPSTATRMLRYTLDIVRPVTMIGPVQDDSRWNVRVPDQSQAAGRAPGWRERPRTRQSSGGVEGRIIDIEQRIDSET